MQLLNAIVARSAISKHVNALETPWRSRRCIDKFNILRAQLRQFRTQHHVLVLNVVHVRQSLLNMSNDDIEIGSENFQRRHRNADHRTRTRTAHT